MARSRANLTPQENVIERLGVILQPIQNDEINEQTANQAHLISLDTLPFADAQVGEFLVVTVVKAANVVRDIRENIRNLTGGRMEHYERLVQQAVEEAVDELSEKALARGYDGVVGVKIVHPTVVDGGVEVIIYGNGFKRTS